MSVMSSITNFIKDEVLGITTTEQVHNTSKSQGAQKKSPVIELKNVEPPIDKFEGSKKAHPKKNAENLNARKARIENKCRAHNINYAEILQSCPQLLNLTVAEFEKLPDSKKAEIFEVVEAIIDNIIEKSKKHGVSKHIKREKIIKEQAYIVYNSLSTGNIENAEELIEEAGDINEELGGKEFDKLSTKEQRKKMEQIAIDRRKAFEARLESVLANVPAEKRAEVEAEMRERFAEAQKMSFNEVVMSRDADVALNGMVILNGNDMGYGAKCVMHACSCSADAERIASENFNYNFQEGLIKTYSERGEAPSAEAVNDFTVAFSSNMNLNALERYQGDYVKARQAFERGEGPSYMKKEYYTATAKGIGTGALYNKSLTLEEKAEFLAKWEREAKSFDDYEIVTKAIKEAIAKDPNFAQKFKEAQKRFVEKNNNNKTEKVKNKVKAVNKKEEEAKVAPQKSNVSTPVSQVMYVRATEVNNSAKESISTVKTTTTEESKHDLQTNPIITPKVSASNNIIIQKIKNTSVNEALKDYTRANVVEAILADPDLSKFYSFIEEDLKQYDITQLIQVTKNCSTKGLLFVLETIPSELAQIFFDKKEKDGLCHSARILGEKRLEESNKEYAIS